MNGHVARELRRFKRAMGPEAVSIRAIKRGWLKTPHQHRAARMDSMRRMVRQAVCTPASAP